MLIDSRYKNVYGGRATNDSEITGLLIAILFAGQHTSSVTSSWTGYRMLSNRKWFEVRAPRCLHTAVGCTVVDCRAQQWEGWTAHFFLGGPASQQAACEWHIYPMLALSARLPRHSPGPCCPPPLPFNCCRLPRRSSGA